MADFFFDVSGGLAGRRTHVRALDDVDAARRCAIQIAIDFVQAQATFADEGCVVVVTARDAAGATVVTVRLVLQAE